MAVDGGNCSSATEPGPCDRWINQLMLGHGAAAIDEFVSQRCDCVERQCSAHGICYGERGRPLRCYCDAGWGSADCSRPTNVTPAGAAPAPERNGHRRREKRLPTPAPLLPPPTALPPPGGGGVPRWVGVVSRWNDVRAIQPGSLGVLPAPSRHDLLQPQVLSLQLHLLSEAVPWPRVR
eukprot:COSAG01_NODE_4118_length_5335_cov_3.316272_4_plen_179_part_00